jgi:hypothetical protein
MREPKEMKKVFSVFLLLICLFSLQSLAFSSLPPLTVYYSYGPDSPVVFSQSNIEVRLGQKLVLLPSPNSPETPKQVRFMTSAGENNFYDYFKHAGEFRGADPRIEGISVIATKLGTGKIQVVPNYSDWDKSGILTATVVE